MKVGRFADLFPAELAQKARESIAAVVSLPYGISMAEVESEIGGDPLWDKILTDPERLYGHAMALLESRIRSQGDLPDGYTAVVECELCGPVFLCPGGPSKLVGCAWCQNRSKGLPIPRPII